MNFSAKNPRHRKAAKRYLPPPKDTTLEKIQQITSFSKRTKPHHFQAHCKRAKRQQHFCKELEKFIIQLCSYYPLKYK